MKKVILNGVKNVCARIAKIAIAIIINVKIVTEPVKNIVLLTFRRKGERNVYIHKSIAGKRSLCNLGRRILQNKNTVGGSFKDGSVCYMIYDPDSDSCATGYSDDEFYMTEAEAKSAII